MSLLLLFPARTGAAARTASDTATATDAAARVVVESRTVGDTGAATDAAPRTVTAVRTAPSTAAASDTATATVVRARTAADAANATDAAPRAVTVQRTATDTAAAADAATRAALTFARSAASTATAVDTATRAALTLGRAANSASAATDAAPRSLTLARTAPSTAQAADAASATGSRSRTATDAAIATDTASTAAASATLTDAFASQDTAKWSGFSANVAVTSGRLSIDATPSYPALASLIRYNLVGSTFAVELVQTPNVSNGSTQAFIEANAGTDGTRTNLIEFGWVNGSLKTDLIVGGVGSDQYVTYDPVQHRHLRIRHAVTTIYWEVSRDGRTWDRIRTTTNTLTLTAVRLRLVAGNFSAAPSPGSALFDNVNLSSYTALAPVSVPRASVSYGVAVDGDPYTALTTWRSLITTFNTDAGKAVGVAAFYLAWSTGLSFPTAVCNDVVAHNETPHIVWEPWDYTGTATQPAYQLVDIIAGTYDAYITTWAQDAAAWGKPFQLRFAHEMNGNWYPWAEAVNGNSAGQYAAAWQHVHDIFVAQGATNAQWVWCPFASGPTALSGLYPGDTYVDLVGLDGYNWGTAAEGGWMSFRDVFSSAITAVQAITSKQLWICETGSAELTATQVGDGKAEWITDAFAEIDGRAEIKGLIWFNYNKERDWRIESSAGATAAFAAGIADPRFGAGGVHGAPDTAAATDVATRTLAAGRAASSASVATDAAGRAALALVRAASSASGAVDTAAATVVTSRTAASTASASDAAVRAVTRGRATADTSVATDVAAWGVAQTRASADSSIANDSASRAPLSFTRIAADAAAGLDAAVRAVARFRTVADASVATDAAIKALLRSRTATDVAAATDAAVRAPLSLTRTANSSALAVDSTDIEVGASVVAGSLAVVGGRLFAGVSGQPAVSEVDPRTEFVSGDPILAKVT